MTSPTPDPLDRLLDQWSQPPDPSPHLRTAVWQHIATHQAANVSWRETVGAWLQHPAVSVGFVAACALIGILAAEVRVSHAQRQRSVELARSYLMLIDPLLQEAAPLPRP